MMRTTNPKKSFSAVDLFSGCGGLTLGLKNAGFQVLGAVDNDALSMETYKANHAEVTTWQLDIRKLPARTMMRELRLRPGQLDLLAGCPPCQAFSTMRTLNGSKRTRDVRNDLVFDFLRFVRLLRPKSVMLENVPGLAKDRRISLFKSGLCRLGYTYRCEVLNAADYGVPQRRRRMIIVAGRTFEPSFAEPSTSKRTVRNAIANLTRPDATTDPLHRGHANRTPRILAMIRHIPRNGGSRNALGRRKQLACHRKCDGFRDVYGRMAWDEVAPTITTGCINPSKGRFLHPFQNRAITLREAMLLQSFPKRYRISLRRGRYPAAALIGNALPPELIRRHAMLLLKSLRSASKETVQHS